MAKKNEKKLKKKTLSPGGPAASRSQARKVQVIESGLTEQGEPVTPRGEAAAPGASAREKRREQERHGGIPIGSDPRE